MSPTSPTPEEAGTIPWPKHKPTPTDDSTRYADARVCPPHLRSSPATSSGLNDGERRWGKGTKGRSTTDAPPLGPNIAFPEPIQHDAPAVTLNIMQKQSKRAHPDTSYDGIWTMRTIYEASQKLTLYLRHGDRQYNYHTDDGFVEVKLILQMPQFRHHKPHPINQRCIEFILTLYDS